MRSRDSFHVVAATPCKGLRTRSVLATLALLTAGLGAVPTSTATHELPDLVVSDIAWSPDPALRGDMVVFTAVVANQGNASASNFTVRFVIENQTIGNGTFVGTLASGESGNVTSPPWNATEGYHAIRAKVDPLDEVAEQDEENNERVEYITVHPRIDLTVVDISWTPANPTSDDTIDVTARVRNHGPDTSGHFAVRFWVSGGVDIVYFFGSLGAGAEVDVTSEGWTLEPGNHTVYAFADWYNDRPETDENNNNRVEWVTVGEAFRPNLEVIDIAWTPAMPVEGDATTFTARVKNTGGADAGDFTVRFLLDGGHLGDANFTGTLAPGQSTNLTSPSWTAVFGDHTIEAVADVHDVVEETDEGDNNLTETVVVAGKADLIVVDIGDGDLPAGWRLNATVRNQGNGTSGDFRVRLAIDNLTLDHVAFNGTLAPGQEVVVGTNVTFVPFLGPYEAKAEADDLDEVDESDETNNLRTEVWQYPASNRSPGLPGVR